jgi:hypothetical protein
LFDKTHVSGASASCPGDIFSDESSGDDVAEIQKNLDYENVKLSSLKNSKPRKRNAKTTLVLLRRRKSKAHFINCIRTLVRR